MSENTRTLTHRSWLATDLDSHDVPPREKALAQLLKDAEFNGLSEGMYGAVEFGGSTDYEGTWLLKVDCDIYALICAYRGYDASMRWAPKHLSDNFRTGPIPIEAMNHLIERSRWKYE